MIDQLHLTLEGSRAEIARLGEAVQGFITRHQLKPAVRTAVRLALEEIVTNVVCHGCCDGRHASIEVELALQSDELVMTVEDTATPFDPLQAPAPDLEAALEDRPIGGLGVHLVRKLMDRVTYERRDGKNRLVMSKIL